MTANRSDQLSEQQRATLRVVASRGGLVLGLLWRTAPLATLVMLALTLVSGVIPTMTALLNRAVLNGLVPSAAGHGPRGVDGGHLIVLAVLMGGVGLVAAVVPDARRYAQGQLVREVSLVIQDRMYRAINAFPGLSRFESPAFSNKIRITQQISGSTVTTLLSSVAICGQSMVTAVSMFVILTGISPVLAVIVAGMAVPAVAAQAANSRKRADQEWQRTPVVRRQMFYGQLLANARAAKEVRLFGLGDFLRDRMLGEQRSVNRVQQALDRRICSVEGALALLDAGVAAGGLVWVVREAAMSRLPIGDVAMFVMAIVGVQGAIGGFVAQMAGVYQSLLLFGHYQDVITADPDLSLADPPGHLPALRTGIEIRDLWFRYDATHPWVLRGVDMVIPHGRSVALIGLNGAGKSTLVKLLCRLYDPQRGNITWDGVDIRNVPPEELRQRIGVVFQDYMTYDMTAAESIGMGDVHRLDDRERIANAAMRAGVHDTLARLPQGYDTMLSRIFVHPGSNASPHVGVNLSGGQWQRLALARGLMRVDRELLILDEPSSGLDAEAEHAIHERLREARTGRASLLVSHRLSAVRDADMIFVLRDGRIAESGTHDNLMGVDGEYRRLFTLQASGYVNATTSRTNRVVWDADSTGHQA